MRHATDLRSARGERMKPSTVYCVTLAAVAAALGARWVLDPWLEDYHPFVTFYVAVVVAAWIGGLRPALVATVLGVFPALYFFVPPRFSLAIAPGPHSVGLATYFMVSLAIAGFGEAMRMAERRSAERGERLRTTLASIGDAVISTDIEGRITTMNPVAEALTGWTNDSAAGQPLDVVFRIVDQETHEKVENPATKALRDGVIVELTNHAVLISKDGVERPIDESAAPIRSREGELVGCVLVFRDITERKQGDEALHRSAETFAALVERSPLGIYTVDADFRIANVSAGSMPAFRNVQPLIGRDFAEVMRIIWPERFASEAIAIFRRVLETGEPYVSPGLTEKRKDIGTIESYEWQVNRVMLADGRFGVVCYFFDATRIQQANQALRESEARFRMLADNMSQLAWTCDQLGNVTWYNQRWLDYTGLGFEDMKGWNWSKVQHPDHLARVVERVRRSAETGEPWDDTFPLRGKDGTYRWFLSRAVPIRDDQGHILFWFGTNTDVTDQRELEQALKDADRRKNEFLAMLAHELRNPLAPIRHAVQVMRLTGGNGEVVATTSEMMERQLGQLVRLVDDLLDVSRISRGKIELRERRIEVASAVNHAVEAIRSQLQGMGHHLSVTLPPKPIYLNADPTRLAQVVGNLLNNACKFTDKGGRIWLTVERESGQAVIRVRDSGIGIAADQLPRIFEMFVQVDTSLERSVSGLGIGLTLVKCLVEMHGGTVEGHSGGIGQGSEFVVRLPIIVETPQPPREPTISEPATPTARRILVVDDNRDATDSLAMLLNLTGNQTHIAHDGLEAVEAAATFRPDVVLLDIGLPKLNGYEACRRIREEPWGKDMVLVALTGWGQEEDRQKSKEAGFDGHLVKPVDLGALMHLFASMSPREQSTG
jgi:PAS domain S-box-containing protein